jgi:hypothetical protein
MKKPNAPGPEERIDWLLTFLQRDLTTLRAGERIDLKEDMVRLLHFRDPSVDLASVEPPDGYAFEQAKRKGAPDLPWPDALVREVQAKIRAGVEHLEAGRIWQPFDVALTPIFRVEGDKTIARSYRGTYLAIMLASAVDLLVQWWPHLQRCAYKPCGLLFRQTHGRQHYHDPKCSKLERWHRLSAKAKRDYKQELVNANRREKLKKTKKRGTS